ncbi:branched-chain amino acid ABC transporter permease [Aquitalea denitrificans]|uniref:branched-chain amino acid ABC transporter permease n=1 Tax=Aquitalea denitrificans TaxID=519081 RepID=UPI001357B19C|nr:branched-chain amino acid ABC transporter permease [Aquitalea denitrificans]
MSSLSRSTRPVLLLAVLWLLLGWLDASYLYRLASMALVFGLLAASANLITGVAGMMTLGHAAFYGVGAYTAALLSSQYQFSPWLTLPLAGVTAALLGGLTAWLTRRLVNVHFAVATLGIGQAVYVTLLNWVDFTRGPMGITDIAPLSTASPAINLGLVMLVFLLCYLLLERTIHSYYGNALRALREDEQCVAAMGLDPARLKIQVMVLGCFIAGLAGALWAHSTRYVSPGDFRFSESITILAMVVIGGLGSLPGAIMGALLLTLLPELLRSLGDYRMLVVGSIMFGFIMFLPKGLIGEYSALRVFRSHLKALEQS